jgi:hypothetical protein
MYCVKEQMTDGTKRISKWGLNITTMITLLWNGLRAISMWLAVWFRRSFINTCIKSLAEDGSIKQPWFDPGNASSEFPVWSFHESIKAPRMSIREDLGVSGHKLLSEDRRRFYLVVMKLYPPPNFSPSVTTKW